MAGNIHMRLEATTFTLKTASNQNLFRFMGTKRFLSRLGRKSQRVWVLNNFEFLT